MTTSSTTPAEPDVAIKKNNWWEVYIIRYFVGTVIGAAVLLYLNTAKTSRLYNLIMPGVTDISKLDMHLLILLGSMGLAFCYIASAPVLALHASRSSFLRTDSKILNWILMAAVALIISIASIWFYISKIDLLIIISITVLALVISLQVIPLAFTMRKNGELAHQYYITLTTARAKADLPSQDYKESYRHLREHGNAFLIVFFEIILGIIFFGSPSPDIAAILLIFWILPAAGVWLQGSLLEYRFSQP